MPSYARVAAELERLKSAKKSAFSRIKSERGKLTNTVSGAASAYVIGRIERGATRPLPTIANIDHKLLYGLGLLGVSMKNRGRWSEAIAGAGDGLLAAYGYAEGRGVPVPFAAQQPQSSQGVGYHQADAAMGTLPAATAEPFDAAEGESFLVGEEEDSEISV